MLLTQTAHDYFADAEKNVRDTLLSGVATPARVSTFHLPEFSDENEPWIRTIDSAATVAAEIASQADPDAVFDVRIELGHARLPHEDVLQLRNGSVVSLDGRIDEPVDIRVGDRLIGRGDVVVLDGKIGVRVLELFRKELSS